MRRREFLGAAGAMITELKDAWAKWDATTLPHTAQNTTFSNKQNSLPHRY